MYLTVTIGIIIAIIVLTNSVLQMEAKRVDTLVLCESASEELDKIQQKFINLVAYNWLKVFSLHQNFSMVAANIMFN
jgi:hypothetical protein